MEKQTNIPQLRFPEFSENWNEEKMGDIFSFKVTNSFSRDNLNYEKGTVKNIHYGDIHTKFQTLFDITKEKVPFINSDISIDRISEDNYCKEGDLILADASEDLNDVGKSIEVFNLNHEKLLAGLHTILARPNLDKFDIGFGGYLFKTNKVRTKIQKEAQGSKVLSISATRLTNLLLDYPTKEEQKKIVKCFSAVDEKIQALKKKQYLLSNYKQGVIQKLFSQEFRFKDSNEKAYPNWEVKKLGDLNIYISDGNYGEQYPKASEMKKEGVPFIRANNIKNLLLVWKDMRFISPEHHEILQSGHLLENDILVTTRGDIGMMAYVTKEFEGSNINAQICLLRTSNNVNPKFLLQYLASSYGLKQFKSLQTGTALKQLPRGNLVRLEIPYPSYDEQTKIGTFLFSIDSKLKLLDINIEELESWKFGLMQKMFC
jgi:type I restriction enzyme, S subunit